MRRVGRISAFNDRFRVSADFRLDRLPSGRLTHVGKLEADELQLFDEIVQLVLIVKQGLISQGWQEPDGASISGPFAMNCRRFHAVENADEEQVSAGASKGVPLSP